MSRNLYMQSRAYTSKLQKRQWASEVHIDGKEEEDLG